MLMIARREGEALELSLSSNIDPDTPVREVFGNQPIIIKVDKLHLNQVKLAIDAPIEIQILREELLPNGANG